DCPDSTIPDPRGTGLRTAAHSITAQLPQFLGLPLYPAGTEGGESVVAAVPGLAGGGNRTLPGARRADSGAGTTGGLTPGETHGCRGSHAAIFSASDVFPMSFPGVNLGHDVEFPTSSFDSMTTQKKERPMNYKGSCHCGNVAFEAEGELD